MNLLWGLVNALQILTTLALINTNFPPNALLFYSIVSNIASFNIFPADVVLFFFDFDKEEDPYNDRFEQMGFEGANAVGNLGVIFVFFLLFAPLYTLYFLVWPFRNYWDL